MKKLKPFFQYCFLARLYRQSRMAFCLVFAFFVCSIAANLIRLETTPFFVWNMYAQRNADQTSYTIFEVRYNGKPLVYGHSWLQPQQVVANDPLLDYLSFSVDRRPNFWQQYLEGSWMQKHPTFRPALPFLINQKDKYEAFPAWYLRYISAITKEKVDDIRVIRKLVAFNHSGQVGLLALDTVLIIH